MTTPSTEGLLDLQERDRRDLTRMIIEWRAFKRWFARPARFVLEHFASAPVLTVDSRAQKASPNPHRKDSPMLSRERKAELVEVTLEMVSAGRAEFQRRCGNMLPESVAECEAAAIAIYGAMRRAMPEEGCGEAEGYRHARRLAEALHAKHYAEVAQWKPLPDLLGVIDQIDNMTTGLARVAPPVAASPVGDKK